MLNIEENTPEWHAIRSRHIGGSEVAALFDMQPDFAMSRYTLFMVKSGRMLPPPVEDGVGSRIWFGRRLEATIANLAAEMYGWEIEKGGYCIDQQTPGMACSLDYVIKRPGPAEVELGFEGPGVLQLKNTDWLNHRREWTMGEPPTWILLQVQQEIACSGFSWGVIVCLIGGNEIPAYRYPARPNVAELLREKIAEFWSQVKAGTAPRVDGTESTAYALREIFPSMRWDAPRDLTMHPDINEVCAQFVIARANKQASDAAVQAVNNELEAILEGCTRAECDGYGITVAVTPDRPGRRGSRRISVTERQR